MTERLNSSVALLTVSCSALLCACSSDEVRVQGSTETLVHSGSNIPFPPTLGDFMRQSIEEGSPAPDGMTAHYLMRQVGSEINVTMSVYRNPDPQSEDIPEKNRLWYTEAQRVQMDAIKAEIIEEGDDPEHRFIALYDVAVERDSLPFFGKRIYYRVKDEVLANAYLFEYGDWFVEYRIVFDRDFEHGAELFVIEHSWGEIEKPVEEEPEE